MIPRKRLPYIDLVDLLTDPFRMLMLRSLVH